MDVDLLEVLLKLDWQVCAHFVSPVHSVFVSEVKEYHQRKDYEKNLRDLESVEHNKGPDFVHDHKLELDGEGRIVEFLVELFLAVFISCLSICQVFLHSSSEEAVLKVNRGDDDGDYYEDKDLKEKCSEFD